MGDTNDNKDMNMNTNDPEMERPMPTRSMAPMGKPKKSKVWLWILLVIILVAGGLAGGYFYSQHQNNQAVEQARQDERTAAQAEIGKLRAELDEQKSTTGTTTCSVDELSLALEAVDAAAGTYTYDLIFTNTGDRDCTLMGYPGVSLVDNSENMIGSPAEEVQGSQELTITLAPQGKVKSIVYAQNSNNFPSGECTSGATKLRVYPPNDTGYLNVATDANLTSWCPQFQVTPVMDV